jgi:hypothetical protein
VFLPETAPSSSQWRLLILDNHGSHESEEFGQLAISHHVQPFYLPKNTSHELQPLDVGCFSPLKTAYRNEIENLGLFDLTAAGSKRRFVEAYKTASIKAFTSRNIRNGFSYSGIWPPGAEHRVLGRLQPLAIPTPSTPPLQQGLPDIPIYQTPTNASQLKQQVEEVLDDISSLNRKHKILARKWTKAIDKFTVQAAANTAKITHLQAQIKAL